MYVLGTSSTEETKLSFIHRYNGLIDGKFLP